MKKLIMILLSIVLVTGCTNTESGILKNYKVSSDTKVSDNLKEPIALSFEEYEQKINNKDSFVLLMWQTGCSHCEDFEPILNKVISYYHLEVSSINRAELSEEEYSKISNKTFVTGTPTTVVFKEGVTQSKKLVGSKDEQSVVDFLVRYNYLEENK